MFPNTPDIHFLKYPGYSCSQIPRIFIFSNTPDIHFLKSRILIFSNTPDMHVLKYPGYSFFKIPRIFIFSNTPDIHVLKYPGYAFSQIPRICIFSNTPDIHFLKYPGYSHHLHPLEGHCDSSDFPMGIRSLQRPPRRRALRHCYCQCLPEFSNRPSSIAMANAGVQGRDSLYVNVMCYCVLRPRDRVTGWDWFVSVVHYKIDVTSSCEQGMAGAW